MDPPELASEPPWSHFGAALNSAPELRPLAWVMLGAGPLPGKFLGSSDSKSSRLHVDIFQFLLYSFEVHSIDSCKMFGNSLEVLNFQLVHM